MNVLIIRSSEWLRANREMFPVIYPEMHGEGHQRGYGGSLFKAAKEASNVLDRDCMCCLGIHARQCGVPTEHLQHRVWPASIESDWLAKVQECYPWAVEQERDPMAIPMPGPYFVSADGAVDAAHINDSFETSDEKKIELLRPLFAEKGWEIDFRPNE